MKGSKFLKVTGILMIIGSAMVILLGVIVAGFGALAAGVGAASGLTGNYFLALLATLVGGICQLVAGIMGVKHCKNPQKAKLLSQAAYNMGRARRAFRHPDYRYEPV